jgi:chorismate--pyruvate lyase
MTAQQQQEFNTGMWQPEPAQAGISPNTTMLSWLEEPGLLTARLRAQCGKQFRLQLVNETHKRAHASDLYRQVALCCDDDPCIFAESRIPLATANAHFWLRDLGNEPLGERLQKHGDVKRGRFMFAIVQPERLPEWIQNSVADTNENLWARRSDFYIGDEELTVTEIFLPAVLHCGG